MGPLSRKFSACKAAFDSTMEPSLPQPTLPLPAVSFTSDSRKGRAGHRLLTFLPSWQACMSPARATSSPLGTFEQTVPSLETPCPSAAHRLLLPEHVLFSPSPARCPQAQAHVPACAALGLTPGLAT